MRSTRIRTAMARRVLRKNQKAQISLLEEVVRSLTTKVKRKKRAIIMRRRNMVEVRKGGPSREFVKALAPASMRFVVGRVNVVEMEDVVWKGCMMVVGWQGKI